MTISGCGTEGGYGAETHWGANRISYNDPNGETFSGSKFKWSSTWGLPSGCLNSDGGSGECGGGCHIGSWLIEEYGDYAYYMSCANADRRYEVWVRNTGGDDGGPHDTGGLPCCIDIGYLTFHRSSERGGALSRSPPSPRRRPSVLRKSHRDTPGA